MEREPGTVVVPAEPTVSIRKALDGVARRREGWARVAAANEVLENKCGTLFVVEERVWKQLLALCERAKAGGGVVPTPPLEDITPLTTPLTPGHPSAHPPGGKRSAGGRDAAPSPPTRRHDPFSIACDNVCRLLQFYKSWYPDADKPWYLQPELYGGLGGAALLSFVIGYGFKDVQDGDPLYEHIKAVAPTLLDFSGLVALHCILQGWVNIGAALAHATTLVQVHDALEADDVGWAEQVNMVLLSRGPHAALQMHILGKAAYETSHDACVTMPLRQYNRLRDTGATWHDIEALLPRHYALTRGEVQQLANALFQVAGAPAVAPRMDMMKPLLCSIHAYHQVYAQFDGWSAAALTQCGLALDGMDAYVSAVLTHRRFTFRMFIEAIAELLTVRKESEAAIGTELSDPYYAENAPRVMKEFKMLLGRVGVPPAKLTSNKAVTNVLARFLEKCRLDPMDDCGLSAYMKMRTLLREDPEVKKWILRSQLVVDLPLSDALDVVIRIYNPPLEYERTQSRTYYFYKNVPQLVALMHLTGLPAPVLASAQHLDAFATTVDRLFTVVTPEVIEEDVEDIDSLVQALLGLTDRVPTARILRALKDFWGLSRPRSPLDILVVWSAASHAVRAFTGRPVTERLTVHELQKATVTRNLAPPPSSGEGFAWDDVVDLIFDPAAPLVLKRVECVGENGPPIPVSPLVICVNAGLLKGCKGRHLLHYCVSLFRDKHRLIDGVLKLRRVFSEHTASRPWELQCTLPTHDAAIAAATKIAATLEWYRPAPLFLYTVFFGCLDSVIHCMYLCWVFCEDKVAHEQRLAGFLDRHPPLHHSRWGKDLSLAEQRHTRAVLADYLESARGIHDPGVKSVLLLRSYETAYVASEAETYFAEVDSKTYDVLTRVVRLKGAVREADAFWSAVAAAVRSMLAKSGAGFLASSPRSQTLQERERLLAMFKDIPAVERVAGISYLHLQSIFKHTSVIDSASIWTKGPLAALPAPDTVEYSVGLFRKVVHRVHELFQGHRDFTERGEEAEANALDGAAPPPGAPVTRLLKYATTTLGMREEEFWLVMSREAHMGAPPLAPGDKISDTAVTAAHWLWLGMWHELSNLVFAYYDVEGKEFLTANHLQHLLGCPIRTLEVLQAYCTVAADDEDDDDDDEEPQPFRAPLIESMGTGELDKRGATLYLATLSFGDGDRGGVGVGAR